ncbi:uncharacterized protein LOC102503223 [Tupaia chinensis]|uniref:uncharacterized protein LOC102503223 n=1 Tax=Tupaia chinensis TaxID=246437 RepID=UPI000703C59D|nr:uncharacterized protein LOC102503223 [Tupaia chinensis]
MQLNPRSQDNTWRHRHQGNCAKPEGGVPSSPEFHQSDQETTTEQLHCPPSPGAGRPRLPHSSENTTLNPTQQEMLAPESSKPGVQGEQLQNAALQKSDSPEEIAPGNIKYRLEPLPTAPLQVAPPGSFRQYFKPRWFPLGTTHGESFKPWKIEPVAYCREKSSHSGALPSLRQIPIVGTTNPEGYRKKRGSQPSVFKSSSGIIWLQGDHDMTTTRQISFQRPLLRQPIFPVHTPGRKVASILRPGHVEYNSQSHNVFQGPGWRQVLPPDPDKSSQAIQHAFLSSQMSYLPSLKSMVKRVKGKCPVDTLGVLKAKFPTETTSQQFFQDWGAQSQVRFGPHERGYGKGLWMGSQALPGDQTTTRTTYMPLFTERVKLCQPQINSIKSEASSFATKPKKSLRPVQVPESQLQQHVCPESRSGERDRLDSLRGSTRFHAHMS